MIQVWENNKDVVDFYRALEEDISQSPDTSALGKKNETLRARDNLRSRL